jgi:molecular chaperone HtpG
MVADKVEVTSRKAGEDKAYKWTSDGKTGYNIEEAARDSQGTDVLLHLNDAGKDYGNSYQLQSIVKKYSNHVAFPHFSWTTTRRSTKKVERVRPKGSKNR